ncbi:MAG: FCD domain-containing protein [Actinobacteria bacterium]|nr:FCD domain-containing protein [Actinomycetota bacterium]
MNADRPTTSTVCEKPIEQTRASDTARRLVLGLIFSGEMGPGDRLPPERELAAQFGISRITLREALKSLEAAGYLVTKVGAHGGTRVNNPAALERCFDEWIRAQGDQLDSLLEFHEIIESTIAALAAQRRTEADLHRLEGARIPKNPTRAVVVERHKEFHNALARAAGNPHLTEAMMTIRREIFVPLDHVIDDQRVDIIRENHDRILAAVRDRDPERAAAEMRKHLVNPRNSDGPRS